MKDPFHAAPRIRIVGARQRRLTPRLDPHPSRRTLLPHDTDAACAALGEMKLEFVGKNGRKSNSLADFF